MSATPSLDGWDIANAEDLAWAPWGEGGKARAKVLANADGYLVVLVEAEAGYAGTSHAHEHAEFSYVLEGRLRNQGRELTTEAAYAAAAGSTHDDFAALEPSRYISIFRL